MFHVCGNKIIVIVNIIVIRKVGLNNVARPESINHRCAVYPYICTRFIAFALLSVFYFQILFLYLLLLKMEYFCLLYALASMIFYSGSCLIVCNVFISDIFEIFYVF